MHQKLKSLAIFSAIFFVASFARAQEEVEKPITLHAGDPAPAITSSKFIKGEPVKSFDKGKVYVVEFWATWCGPCIQSIPHLTELQKKYKDITFIGQNCSEQDQSAVEPFVKEMGDKMDYRVAMDDVSDGGRGKMHDSWLQAAGEDGIPTAFLVDGQGVIRWIGHPMNLDKVIDPFLAGTFDWKKEADKSSAMKVAMRSLRKALMARDFDKALATIDELEKTDPSHANQMVQTRLQLMIMKQDFDGAAAYVAKNYDSFKDDADALNGIAWMLAGPDTKFPKPDLDLALKCALRAADISKNDPGVVDTLANIYAAKGDLDKAIELETDAVARADAGLKEELQKTLDGFKAKKSSAK